MDEEDDDDDESQDFVSASSKLDDEPPHGEEEGNDDDEHDHPSHADDQDDGSTLRSLSSRAAVTPSILLLEQVLCFACGMGSSICYVATLSSLVYFKRIYGANSFILLNVAIYLPLLPISVAQALWDQKYDRRYTSRNTFLIRGMIGFLFGLVGTFLMMINPLAGLSFVVLNALLQGTGGAILYGTLNQLVSFAVPAEEDSDRLKTAVSSGVQAAALVVLCINVITNMVVRNEDSKFPTFLWSIFITETLCFLCFLWLLRARPVVMAAMINRDSSFIRLDTTTTTTTNNNNIGGNDDDLSTPLIEQSSSSSSSSSIMLLLPEGNSSQSMELSLTELWNRTKDCCSILVVTLVPSFLVGSWFTQVKTNWAALASWLFYVRIGSDLLGRLVIIILPPRSVRCLQTLSSVRLLFVVAFFLNARQSLRLQGMVADLLSLFLVTIISSLSGYLVTGGYQLAPLNLDIEIRSTNAPKQASLLTVAFAVSATIGVLSSFVLMGIGI